MKNVYTYEKINFIALIVAWLSTVILCLSQYLIRYRMEDCIIILFLGSNYIIPTILYIRNKDNILIKYYMVFGTMAYIFIVLFIQNGRYDNTFFLLVVIGVTAVYFDVKLTIITTLLNMFVSAFFYVYFKYSFFPIFSYDNFIALELAYLIMGTIITVQTYWSKKLLFAYKSLYEKAIRDNLTNLYNRTYFMDHFTKVVEDYKVQNKQLCAIILDVDNFKYVNDTFGHAKGDLVLKTISKCITSVCRSSDIVARIGGEEFMILLKDLDIEAAFRLSEEIRVAVEQVSIDTIVTTISLGLTSMTKEDRMDDIFERADKALYMAKNSGKNRTIIL